MANIFIEHTMAESWRNRRIHLPAVRPYASILYIFHLESPSQYRIFDRLGVPEWFSSVNYVYSNGYQFIGLLVVVVSIPLRILGISSGEKYLAWGVARTVLRSQWYRLLCSVVNRHNSHTIPKCSAGHSLIIEWRIRNSIAPFRRFLGFGMVPSGRIRVGCLRTIHGDPLRCNGACFRGFSWRWHSLLKCAICVNH